MIQQSTTEYEVDLHSFVAVGGLVEKFIFIDNLIAQDIVLSKINCSKVAELIFDEFGKFSTVTLYLLEIVTKRNFHQSAYQHSAIDTCIMKTMLQRWVSKG